MSASSLREQKGWHSRGYLPHLDSNGLVQFVTFRLGGSLPSPCMEAWRAELECLANEEREEELRTRVEACLDLGLGPLLLGVPEVGSIVASSIRHFDGTRYSLHDWVVMPNHVHVVLEPLKANSLSGIVHSWKSFTAKKANEVLGREGRFWSADYFDRYLRDEEHYLRTRQYVEENPIKAGLCQIAEEWPFSSARRRWDAGTVEP